jgi:hypothetical protein
LPGSPSKGQRSGTRIRDGHSGRATLVANGRSYANARKDLVAGAATNPPPLRVMLPLGAPPPIVLSVVSSQDLTRRFSDCSATRSEPLGVDERGCSDVPKSGGCPFDSTPQYPTVPHSTPEQGCLRCSIERRVPIHLTGQTVAPCRSGMASVGTSTGSPSTGRSGCAGRKQQENAPSRSRVNDAPRS